jgi:hypothetical protein
VRRLALFAGIVLLAACGGTETAPLPVLPTAAVPDLESSTEDVGLRDLVADFGATQENFEGRFSGFVRGRERIFQGESHKFDRVVSRTLEFEDAAGARSYVSFYGAHMAAAFGTGTTKSAIRSGGRAGYLIDAASCACHRAEPTLAAVLAAGERVTYLEVNGGGATRQALVDLLEQAP